MVKMNEEALNRIKAGGDLKETEKVRKAPVSYRSAGQLPRESEVKELKIYVGNKFLFEDQLMFEFVFYIVFKIKCSSIFWLASNDDNEFWKELLVDIYFDLENSD